MEKLNVIITISNPCNYKKRYNLTKKIIKKLLNNENINLYIVELAYSCNNKFVLTTKYEKNHLQITADIPIWHKENLINIGVNNLLPKNWENFSWIDADIEFLNEDWAEQTLKTLKTKDVVQMFSFCHDLNEQFIPKKIFASISHYYCLYGKGKRCNDDVKASPGFAWAVTREFYEKIGGLFEYAIVGGADLLMYNCFSKDFNINVLSPYFNINSYKNKINFYLEKSKNCNLGYVPLTIRHFFHGSRKNRQYGSRMQILTNNYFELNSLDKNDIGLLVPNKNFNEKIKNEFLNYLYSRREDN